MRATLLFIVYSLLLDSALQASVFPEAPTLPLTGTRIVRVGTEAQLQAAMGNLRSGDTILLSNGVYHLTSHLIINGRNNVTIRGENGSTNVALAGKGMDNRNHGGVLHGVWSNGTNTTVAHLTIRETYDNPIIFNSPAQGPRVYSVRLIDAGSQFIKSNPTDVDAGRGVNEGRVEHSWFEYTVRPPNDHGAGVGYFNGISAHAARNWVVRANVFKNLHNPDGSAYPWNPAVLFWRNSSNTVTEGNVFINVDRAVAYGLDNSVPYRDHSGGIVRNNFIYLEPGFFSASRKASADGMIIVWNSPGTQVDHNTIQVNGNAPAGIEFRFATTVNTTARNNLADVGNRSRDSAIMQQSGNLNTARTNWFVNPALGDLHLSPAATNAIDKATLLNTVTNDFDGVLRTPTNGKVDVGADEFSVLERPRILDVAVEGVDARFQFTTAANVEYAVDRADLLGSSWMTVASNLLGDGSVKEFTDLGAADASARFYRVRFDFRR
ncbi:MAG TPA: hypothetical protein VF773_19255 [Verrucomicrobiae bacterium]